MAEDLLSLKWNNHKPAFFHLLKTLREKGRHTDVTLTCGSQFFPAHRLVLVACSQFFSEVLEHTGCGRPVIVLKDVCAGEMEALLDYMYLGEVDVPQTSLPGLIRAAESLKIKGLAVPDTDPNATTTTATTTTAATTTTTTTTATGGGGTTTTADDENQEPPPPPHPTTITTTTSDDHETPEFEGRATKRRKVTDLTQNDLDLNSELQIQITEVKTEAVDLSETTFDPADLEMVPGQGQLQHFLSEEESHAFEVMAGQLGQAGVSGAHNAEGQECSTNDSSAHFPSPHLIGSQLQDDSQSTPPPPLPPPPPQPSSPPPHRDQDGRLCYLCPFCSRPDADKSKWRRHIRSHTGEKPYLCPKCPYRSATRHAVLRHQKFRH